MPFTIYPPKEKLLRSVRRKYAGSDDFCARVDGALLILEQTPRRHSNRITKLRDGKYKGMYRYKHGKCRVIYDINDGKETVAILKIALRDEHTYDE